MGSSGFTNPPLPTNDGGTPSSDTALNLPQNTIDGLQMMWDWAKTNSGDIAKTLGSIYDQTQKREKDNSFLAQIFNFLVVAIAKGESAVLEEWVQLEAEAYQGAAAPLSQAAATEAGVAMSILLEQLSGPATGELSFGGSSMGAIAQQFFNELIQPFTLVNAGIQPAQVGSGIQAQQYLLSQAAKLSLNEWIVDQLGNHLGMGFFKTLSPFLGILDRSLNPSNVVRQAMESSYALLLRAPLTRDLNHAYPIKDLGVTALAKLYLRGAIDQATFLNKCLDYGLDNTQAQQLVLETTPPLPRGDIAKLLSLNYITQQDARNLLAQQGYLPATIDAILYLDTHYRYFQIAERVGYAAVTAWKKGQITQQTLESILQQNGFGQDEITLLEIEGQFTKQHGQKSLSYGQVKELFAANIIGESDVLTFLENEGYSQTDSINLLLLDFTKEAERTAVRNRMIQSLRVTQQNDLVEATADAAKSEAALAAARTQLAAELDAEATALGRIETVPGIIGLLGGLP